MPVRFQNRCPVCSSWIEDDEGIHEDSDFDFQCPKCKTNLEQKKYFDWLFFGSIFIVVASHLLEIVCNFDWASFCVAWQANLSIIGNIAFIVFIACYFIQNLKPKNT